MKIWEAIIYGILGGLTELLPVSFQGHYAFFRGAFNLSSLSEGAGCYLRPMLCLGVMIAVILSFSVESGAMGHELLKMTGVKKRRRGDKRSVLLRRSILLCIFALIPMLLSLLLLQLSDRIGSLLYTAAFFLVNGLLLSAVSRYAEGEKEEAGTTVADALLIGLGRALSCFPGLSSVGTSLCIGRMRGLSQRYNFRLAYILTLVYQAAAFVYYLIRALLYGSFSAGLLLPMLLALVFSAVAGYLAIAYLRYMLRQNKLHSFSYYCWTLAGVTLLLSLINA